MIGLKVYWIGKNQILLFLSWVIWLLPESSILPQKNKMMKKIIDGVNYGFIK